MKHFFSMGPGVRNFLQGESGKSYRGFLLALLLILAVSGYIYYFTDLIRPIEETGAQTPHNSLLKKPLPPRPKIPGTVEEGNPTAAPQQVADTFEEKAGAVQSAPVESSTEKKTSSPQQTGTKRSASKSESGKPSKEIAARRIPAKSTTPVKVSANAESVKEAIKTEKKQEEAEPEKPAAKTPCKPVKGTYTLLIGVFLMDKSMTTEKAKLKSAGLNPVITKGPKKMEPMNRLFIGEFDSYPEASIELIKLGKATHDAFILPEKGKYALYAGSYFIKERAEKERDRLSKAGLKPLIRKINVPVSTFRLTAGNFETRKSAEQEAERLKKLDVKALVVKSGM